MAKKKNKDEMTPEELEYKKNRELLWDGDGKQKLEAINFFKQQIQQGNALACYNYASYLLFGCNSFEENKEGFEVAKTGFKFGNADCYALIGKCYEKGLGIKKDKETAKNIYEELAKQGNQFATFALAEMLFFDKNPQNTKKAIKMFEELAENDFAKAKYRLGLLYQNGDGVKKDFKKALYWYERCIAENDFNRAFCNVGTMYLHGNGVKKDYDKAVEYFANGANNHDARCVYMLAHCYHNGYGVEKNEKKAISLLKRAEARGDKHAGKYLEEAIGFKRNEKLERKNIKAFFDDPTFER